MGEQPKAPRCLNPARVRVRVSVHGRPMLLCGPHAAGQAPRAIRSESLPEWEQDTHGCAARIDWPTC